MSQMQQPPASDWSQMLRQVRKSLRLSRAKLAERAGVSVETVKAYELGTRHPSRSLLTAILNATKVERVRRDEILVAAGFAPDSAEMGADRYPNYYFALAEAQDHVDEMPWPAFVMNEYTEVMVANRLVEKLWGVGVKDYPDQTDRNIIRFASDPRFGDRLVNWDDMMRVGVAVFKGHHRGGETLDQPSSYFDRILEDFIRGDPSYVGRLARLWAETPPNTPKNRWTYRVVWNEPGIGVMSFLATVTTCNESQGHAFNDWVPVDAQTWECLEALRRRED